MTLASLQTDSAALHGDDFRDLEDARRLNAAYIPYFLGCRRVLDVASGYGLLLDGLRETGVSGEGLDHFGPAVECSRAKGHKATQAEALFFLKHTNRSWDGIMLSHIIEHFEMPRGRQLITAAWSRLELGGVMVIVTPNCDNPSVENHGFWLDPTHVQPYELPYLQAVITCLGGHVLASGDSEAERNRFRRRFQKPLSPDAWRGRALWLKLFIRSGYNCSFLLGDNFIVARKSPRHLALLV